MEEDEEEDGKEEEKEEEKKEDAPAKKKTKRGAAKKATPKKRAEKKKKVPKPAFVFPPSLSFVSSMSKERQEMFALSGKNLIHHFDTNSFIKPTSNHSFQLQFMC